MEIYAQEPSGNSGEGNSALLAQSNIVTVVVEECKTNPNTEGCQPPECETNPNAEGCKPPDCETNPNAEGCKPPECETNPDAEGCKPPDCETNPDAEECNPDNENYQVAVEPNSLSFSGEVGEGLSDSFTLIHKGEQNSPPPIDFSLTQEGDFSVTLSSTSGSLNKGGDEQVVDVSLSCFEEGNFSANVLFNFKDENGQDITEGVPKSLPISLTCTEKESSDSESAGSGGSYGHPNFVTYDQARYVFHGAG